MRKKNKEFGLLCESNLAKVWQALAVMSKCEDWVFIDDVVAFLVARQKEAIAHKYHPECASTMYARKPNASDMQVWDEPLVLHALQSAIARGIIDVQRTQQGYFFFAKKKKDHFPWRLRDEQYTLKVDPKWIIQYRTLEEKKHVC